MAGTGGERAPTELEARRVVQGGDGSEPGGHSGLTAPALASPPAGASEGLRSRKTSASSTDPRPASANTGRGIGGGATRVGERVRRWNQDTVEAAVQKASNRYHTEMSEGGRRMLEAHCRNGRRTGDYSPFRTEREMLRLLCRPTDHPDWDAFTASEKARAAGSSKERAPREPHGHELHETGGGAGTSKRAATAPLRQEPPRKSPMWEPGSVASGEARAAGAQRAHAARRQA